MNPYSDIYNQNNVRQFHFGPRPPYGQRPVGGFDQFRPRQMRPRFDAVSPGQFGMSPRFLERGSSQTYQPRAVYNYQTSQAQHPSFSSFVNGQSGVSLESPSKQGQFNSMQDKRKPENIAQQTGPSNFSAASKPTGPSNFSAASKSTGPSNFSTASKPTTTTPTVTTSASNSIGSRLTQLADTTIEVTESVKNDTGLGSEDKDKTVTKKEEMVDAKGNEKKDNMDDFKVDGLAKKDDDGDDDDDDDSSDEDTSYCKYCKLSFSSDRAFHGHTRGLRHVNLVMEAQEKKKQEAKKPDTADSAQVKADSAQIKADSAQVKADTAQVKAVTNRTESGSDKAKYNDKNITQSVSTASKQDANKGQFGNMPNVTKITEDEKASIGSRQGVKEPEKNYKEMEDYNEVADYYDGGGGYDTNDYGDEYQDYYGYDNENPETDQKDKQGGNNGQFSYETYDKEYNSGGADWKDYNVSGPGQNPNQGFGNNIGRGRGIGRAFNSGASEQFSYSEERSSSSIGGGQFYNESSMGQSFNSGNDTYVGEGTSGNTTEQVEEEDEDDDDDDDEEDEDTSYCKYCKKPFSTPVAYFTHTRGLQHITLVMEEKSKKGDKRYEKEKVHADVLKVDIPEPKPEPVPLAEGEDEDDESNWMNLDEYTKEQLRNRPKPKDRDLNPDDIGKKQFLDDFSCALCNIKCTSAMTFKMHVAGKQHQNNLQALEQGNQKLKQKKSTATVFTDVDGEAESKFISQIAVDFNDAAIVGLEYITEFQKPDLKSACRYVCNLCTAKCDESTVIAHVIGMKHRLHYFRENHKEIYEHLTKFNTKKKKSETNANCEMFAQQIEEKEGRKDVKVKLELETVGDDEDLNATMARMSRALKEKMEEIKKEPTGKRNSFTESREESPFQGREFSPGFGPGPMGRGIPHPYDDREEPPLLPPRFGRPPRGPPGPPPPPHYGYPYDEYRDSPYYSPYHRRDEYEYDLESRRLEDMMLDRYRLSDPYLEHRRLQDLMDRQRSLRLFESRRLDELMRDRHRLKDPELETRRLDDILERKRKIEESERTRLEDILRRKRDLEENDVDKLRLERFEKLKKMREDRDVSAARDVSASRDVSAARDLSTARDLSAAHDTDRPSMEELTARRKANLEKMHREDRPRIDEYLLPGRISTSTATSTTPVVAERPVTMSTSAAPSSSNISSKTTSAAATARRVMQDKGFQEELAKNPGINVGDLLSDLSTSMIATEDDAAMALQISNTLTQALLRFRLQHANKQLSKLGPSSTQSEKQIPGYVSTSSQSKMIPGIESTRTVKITPKLDSTSTQSAKSIPGIGPQNPGSEKTVPSFLRTNPKKQTKEASDSRYAQSAPAPPHVATSSNYQGIDILKSIREETQKLQAHLASSFVTHSSASQPGIQAHSQFVHGQSQPSGVKAPSTTAHASGLSPSTSKPEPISYPPSSGTTIQTIASKRKASEASLASQIPSLGTVKHSVKGSVNSQTHTSSAEPYTSSAMEYSAGVTYPYSTSIDYTAGVANPYSTSQAQPTSASSSYLSHWYQSMYRQNTPAPAPPLPGYELPAPPPPPPRN